MNDLNKVTIIGNVVRDPDTESLTGSGRLARFTLATTVEEQHKNVRRLSVEFHEIMAVGKLGDIIRQYVKKGANLYVEGRLRTRAYVAKDGARRTTTEIVADNIIMLGHRSRASRRVSKNTPA